MSRVAAAAERERWAPPGKRSHRDRPLRSRRPPLPRSRAVASSSETPYPEGDWRHDALAASLADEGRVHREAAGRHHTYALTLAYDGENYLGFQYQPRDAKTVQGEVEKALTKITGEDRDFLGIQASGRTDAGVHARGQVLHFYARRPIEDLARFQRSMNGVLPRDVRVMKAIRPHPAFHARFHAVRKTYHYYLDTRLTMDPFLRRHALHVGWNPPDVEKLRRGAECFVGTRDFSAFSNKPRDKTLVRDPVRTIYRFDVNELKGDGLLRLEVEGNGFMYKQVRNMVGAMITAATSKKMQPADIAAMLEGKDRGVAPMGAPAHWLFLHDVVYPRELLEWVPPDDDEESSSEV